MGIKKIERNHWKSYFEQLAHRLVNQQGEIEVDALTIGSQRVTDWVPLLGVLYDPREDLLAVMMEGVDHMIRHPQAIHIDEADTVEGAPASLQVVDAEQARHIVKFRPAPAVP